MIVHYLTDPDSKQLAQAADLIDAGGQLANKLDRVKFSRSCVIAVALNQSGKVVGVSAVKERRGLIAETGYLIVEHDYRGNGVATELTRRRVEAAKQADLDLLFTNVRQDNEASIGNLRKAGFSFFGDFLSAYETGRPISWYYLPLKPNVDWKGHLDKLTRHLEKAPTKAEAKPAK